MKRKKTLLLEIRELKDRDDRLKKELSKISSVLGESGWHSFYRAVEQSPASIVITDAAGNIEYVNPKFERLTGYSKEEVLGKNPRVLKSGETSGDEYEDLWETITAGKTWRGEFHNNKNGELYWEYASISGLVDDDGNVTHFVAVKEDITERKEMEQALESAYQTIQVQQSQMLNELDQARETQLALLPTVLPDIPNARIAYKYVPMEGRDSFNDDVTLIGLDILAPLP